MPAFDAELKREYLARVERVNEAICDLERWLGDMSSEKRLSFLLADPVAYDGKGIVICDEDLILEMEELTRDDDEDGEDGDDD